jgi:hypothetical protein
MRLITSCAGIMLLTVLCTGCQSTASGRAIESHLGNAIQPLESTPRSFLSEEVMRGQTLISALHPRRLIRAFHINRLSASIAQASTGITDSARGLRNTISNSAAPLISRSSRDFNTLIGDHTRGLRQRNRVAKFSQELRIAQQAIPRVLRLDKSLMPGPGDLDRTTDPNQVGRSLTWVERFLRRF